MDTGLKIVVIDDTPEILDLLALVLADEGFQVVCCREAHLALDVVAAERPALIVVDLMIGGTHGWDLVDALAADRRTSGTPFLVCSGAVQELQAAEGQVRSLGGDVLAKPFDIDELLTKVRQLIGERGPA